MSTVSDEQYDPTLANRWAVTIQNEIVSMKNAHIGMEVLPRPITEVKDLCKDFFGIYYDSLKSIDVVDCEIDVVSHSRVDGGMYMTQSWLFKNAIPMKEGEEVSV
jgi:hypothetical protein